MKEPLSPADVRKLAREIMKTGTYSISSHARKEMANDKLIESDVLNVLRGGHPDGSKTVIEAGSWRYQICTRRMTAVVAFRSPVEMVVVTCWRLSS